MDFHILRKIFAFIREKTVSFWLKFGVKDEKKVITFNYCIQVIKSINKKGIVEFAENQGYIFLRNIRVVCLLSAHFLLIKYFEMVKCRYYLRITVSFGIN